MAKTSKTVNFIFLSFRLRLNREFTFCEISIDGGVNTYTRITDFQTPHTCQTQLSGEPLIIETKNLLAMTEVIVQSANSDVSRVQNKIKELRNQLRHNATDIREKIETVLNDTLESVSEKKCHVKK